MPTKKPLAVKKSSSKKRTTLKQPSSMGKAPATIDAYLATISGEKRRVLDELRALLRSLLPNAEECISYGLPAFRVAGTVLAGFKATAKGCSYYPFSGQTLATLATELEGYSKTSGALHFTPDNPLPRALVRKLLAARAAED